MSGLMQDVRFALRALLKAPLFTLTIVATLAFGIGANTALFGVVNALLLHPVSYPDLERMVMVWERVPRERLIRGDTAPANYLDWKAQSKSFEALAAYGGWSANLGGDAATGALPKRLEGTAVAPEFFRVFAIPPAHGRAFMRDEAAQGRDQVVMLSDALWRSRYDADPEIVGRALRINGRPMTVVGIMPPGFDFPFGTEIWTPLTLGPEDQRRRETHTLAVVGRLATGVSAPEAQSELGTIARRLEQQWPATNQGRGVTVLPLSAGVVDEISPQFILLLMGAAVFVLIIACANVAGLMLARAASRKKEIGIRGALGASRGRVIRLLLVESVILALIGSVIGLLVASSALDLMRAAVPLDTRRYIPGFSGMRIDIVVLGFTMLTALATSVFFGLAPALQTARVDLRDVLSETGRGSRSVPGRRARQLLVVGEVAIALVLLVGSGLLVRGFQRLASPERSFEPGGVLVASVMLSDGKYPAPEQRREFWRMTFEALESVPGVASVGGSSRLPWRGQSVKRPVGVEGEPERPAAEAPHTAYRMVTPGFFRTLDIPLVEGRGFGDLDREGAQRVAIVSRSLARQIAPRGSAIGRRIRVLGRDDAAPWLAVVGVVGDLKSGPFDREASAFTYVPIAQSPPGSMELAIRATGDPAALAPAVRSAMMRVDPDQPLHEVRTFAGLIADRISGVRLSAMVMGVFGVLAMLLSGIGIYGLVAHSVVNRTHEFGVRMALGADSGDVVRMVMGQGVRLAAIGVAVGWPLAFGLSHVLGGLLAGIAGDPAALVLLPALLFSVVLLASWLPARGATRVDPMLALRSE